MNLERVLYVEVDKGIQAVARLILLDVIPKPFDAMELASQVRAIWAAE